MLVLKGRGHRARRFAHTEHVSHSVSDSGREVRRLRRGRRRRLVFGRDRGHRGVLVVRRADSGAAVTRPERRGAAAADVSLAEL